MTGQTINCVEPTLKIEIEEDEEINHDTTELSLLEIFKETEVSEKENDREENVIKRSDKRRISVEAHWLFKDPNTWVKGSECSSKMPFPLKAEKDVKYRENKKIGNGEFKLVKYRVYGKF